LTSVTHAVLVVAASQIALRAATGASHMGCDRELRPVPAAGSAPAATGAAPAATR